MCRLPPHRNFAVSPLERRSQQFIALIVADKSLKVNNSSLKIEETSRAVRGQLPARPVAAARQRELVLDLDGVQVLRDVAFRRDDHAARRRSSPSSLHALPSRLASATPAIAYRHRFDPGDVTYESGRSSRPTSGCVPCPLRDQRRTLADSPRTRRCHHRSMPSWVDAERPTVDTFRSRIRDAGGMGAARGLSDGVAVPDRAVG